MAAARAGVLGVRWLQKAARNVVPLGARTASHITKDMLPGPYPKTPEERAAAAKKYNMRVKKKKKKLKDAYSLEGTYPGYKLNMLRTDKTDCLRGFCFNILKIRS
uniref:Uncharacterized protein n=1 Tax=Bos indicus x Bos taurus TaxID=30522 RepID=A0A4W2ED44_BOBOX